MGYFLILSCFHYICQRSVLHRLPVSPGQTIGEKNGSAAFDTDKIEISTDYIAGYDRDLNIVVWNSAMAEKYGTSKDNALGRNLLDLFPHIHSDFRVRCYKETISFNKSFYFSKLPFVYEAGTYSQLIIPVMKDTLHFDGVISIIREHQGNETYIKTDLLFPVLSADLAAASGHIR